MGDKFINAAIPAAPKKVAVVMPSILPLDFLFGTMRTAPINNAYGIPFCYPYSS
jgi:hypothetical protein